MTDERFDRDLRAVLEDIAPVEVPVELRMAVLDVSHRGPRGRRWRLSARWLAAAFAGVAVLLTAALGVAMPRPFSSGPTAGGMPPMASPVIPSASGAASLTLYVRNGGSQQAWFTVVSPGEALSDAAMGAIGFGAHGAPGFADTGVGCRMKVRAQDRLVLVDRPPQQASATILRVIYEDAAQVANQTLWVDIAADGTVTQGASVPVWWNGPPQPGC